ncbi:MAG: DGQHR domain-containing protein [bacterium]
MEKNVNPINLPCLRGKIGDWFFYTSVMSFKEIATRIKLPEEIDKKYEDDNLKLEEWIQRKIETKRIKPLVKYIEEQEQRFFNSLVLGIYDGAPSWQDLNISGTNIYSDENDETLRYLSKTFGILNLSGAESIFAIDGQHRAVGIRKAVKDGKADLNDEITVILVAHSIGDEGKIRTRRLFSTLNRYAKPVSESEKIALSEDDNCAVLTRRLIEEHDFLKGKILLNKSRSVHPSQDKYFTSIMVLYDIVKTILVEKRIPGIGNVSGYEKESFLHIRANKTELDKQYEFISNLFNNMISKIDVLHNFFVKGNPVDRNSSNESILFRPIGQNILFDILKVGLSHKNEKSILEYFDSIDFSFKNKIWHSIFWDSETNTIVTDKMRQRFVTLLILEKLGFNIKRTYNDKKKLQTFNISIDDI